jgi:hypothetical protein
MLVRLPLLVIVPEHSAQQLKAALRRNVAQHKHSISLYFKCHFQVHYLDGRGINSLQSLCHPSLIFAS